MPSFGKEPLLVVPNATNACCSRDEDAKESDDEKESDDVSSIGQSTNYSGHTRTRQSPH